MLAHFQIWWEFVFFDHDVLLFRNQKKHSFPLVGTYNSTTFSSVSGQFALTANGTLLKNGLPFREDDILVVFEDDIDVAVSDHRAFLQDEFNAMNVDLLFLGWCEGRLARPVPLCSHAYALTRGGARKVLKHFEICGRALDEQFVIMGKNKWITYRTVDRKRVDQRIKPEKRGDRTQGIFHQLKTLGSLNGH